MPYTAKQRALFNARARSDPKFKELAEEANRMAAKKQPMGAAKTRTGKQPMPKKGAIKKSSANKSMVPKGEGAGPYTGGGVGRSGGSGY